MVRLSVINKASQVWYIDVALEPGVVAMPDGVSFLLAAELGDVSGLSVLEVGCASGFLSIFSCASGACHVHAIDVEKAAVNLCKRNAKLNDFDDKIEVQRVSVQGFSSVKKFDRLISYPPILPKSLIKERMPYADWYSGGVEGVDVLRYIIDKLPYLLKSGGFALFPVIAGRQQETVTAMINQNALRHEFTQAVPVQIGFCRATQSQAMFASTDLFNMEVEVCVCSISS